jgi:hypothetical protein
MSQQAHAILQRLLRDNDLDWMIDRYAPPDRAIPDLLEQLERVATEYGIHSDDAVPFSLEALQAEAVQNPHKVRAFLQALGTSRSAEMLVMVWRILQGSSIRKVEMNYREGESFSLHVVLARHGEDDPEYRSRDINDAALVRHFGITTINGRPLFDGFYPLRLRRD